MHMNKRIQVTVVSQINRFTTRFSQVWTLNKSPIGQQQYTRNSENKERVREIELNQSRQQFRLMLRSTSGVAAGDVVKAEQQGTREEELQVAGVLAGSLMKSISSAGCRRRRAAGCQSLSTSRWRAPDAGDGDVDLCTAAHHHTGLDVAAARAGKAFRVRE